MVCEVEGSRRVGEQGSCSFRRGKTHSWPIECDGSQIMFECVVVPETVFIVGEGERLEVGDDASMDVGRP